MKVFNRILYLKKYNLHLHFPSFCRPKNGKSSNYGLYPGYCNDFSNITDFSTSDDTKKYFVSNCSILNLIPLFEGNVIFAYFLWLQPPIQVATVKCKTSFSFLKFGNVCAYNQEAN